MGQRGSISFSESENDYIEHIEQLEKDILSLNTINKKDEPSLIDEVKLIVMSARIKKNMEIVSILVRTLRSTHEDEKHIYYYVCSLLNFSVKTVEAFNAKQRLL